MAGCGRIAVTAYIGLGSNLGSRRAAIRTALELLGAPQESSFLKVITVSSLIETDAVGGPPGQRRYVNGAAEILTTLGPEQLLERAMSVERALGRVRDGTEEKWGPRTIDIDILLYGEETVKTPELTVPHPRMHERAFVLEPLCEIAPEVYHPVLGLTVHRMLEAIRERKA